MSVKLSESKLRQIIREEARRISEISTAAGYKKRVGKGAMAPGGYDDPMDYAPWANAPKETAPELKVGQRRCWVADSFKVVAVDEEEGLATIEDETGSRKDVDIDLLWDSALISSV
jgi:hypothetical protein